jgi:type IV pilus assembly protein PilA
MTDLIMLALKSGKFSKKEGGFTLIELLVVIVIVGVLAAIALPSFLAQAAKGRTSEAINNVGVVNRAQLAYYNEKKAFAPTTVDLGITLPASGIYSPPTITASGTTVTIVYNGNGDRDVYGVSGMVDAATGSTIVCRKKIVGGLAPNAGNDEVVK